MEAKTFNIIAVAGIALVGIFSLSKTVVIGRDSPSTIGFPGWGFFTSMMPDFSGNWASTSHYLKYNTPDPSAFWASPLPDLTNNALGYSAYDSYFNTQSQNPRF